MTRYAERAREIVGDNPPPIPEWKRERLRALFAPAVAKITAQREEEVGKNGDG